MTEILQILEQCNHDYFNEFCLSSEYGVAKLSIKNSHIHIHGKDGCCYGVNNGKGIELYIPHREIEKHIVLHEITHFYQQQLDFFKIELLVFQYIEWLQENIVNYQELVHYYNFFLHEFGKDLFPDEETQKDHDLAFFLKSLQLDALCNYPTGTVFGYAFPELFRKAGVSIKK